MFATEVVDEAPQALAALDGALEAITTLAASNPTGGTVLALLRGLEAHRRRLAAVDHALLFQVDDQRLPFEHGHRGAVPFLQQLLHISASEASARVRAAAELGPRRELTGAPLPPLFPQVAAAEAAGAISPAHARRITTVIESLPAEVQAEHGRAAEAFLVEQARLLAVEPFSRIAQRLKDTLHPDEPKPDERRRAQHRGLAVSLRADGSSRITGELTAATTEALLTVLDATSAPQPERGGVKDPRTATQRRHDGLLDALLLVLRAGALPKTAGVTTTIILTMSTGTAEHRTGLVRTGHGALISYRQAEQLISDSRWIAVIHDRAKRVEAYTDTHRLFTEGQRLAMIARDNGCSFPGCSAGPLWCEAHHITDWTITKRTTINDGTLLCGPHHRDHQTMGWTCRMIDGTPHWIPPAWLDPDQTPQRNHMHDPELVLT